MRDRRVRCDTFLERVDALLGGSLREADREEMLGHLETCAECRDLAAALASADDAPVETGLADSILARTSGAACGTARARLCGWIDGELDAVDAELLTVHVGACSSCGDLARVLLRLPDELPALAEADPGPRFVASVLSRTSLRPQPVPFRVRIGAALERLLARPRVAWEGAFVATFVLIAPAFAPGSPLSGMPGRGLDLVREPTAEQRLALGALRGHVDDLEATFVGGARSALANAGALVADSSTAVGSGLARSSTSTWESIRRSLGTFPGSDASGQEAGAAGTDDRAPAGAQEKKR